jgi:secreted trypsin-like serine protease
MNGVNGLTAMAAAAMLAVCAAPAVAEQPAAAAAKPALSPAQAKAAAHAELAAAARDALPSLAALRQAIPGGLGPAFAQALGDYAGKRGWAEFIAQKEAAFEPGQIKAEADYASAAHAARVLSVLPDTTALAMAQARDAVRQADNDQQAARAAAIAAVIARLDGEGLGLPDPDLPELWAKGATAQLPFRPVIAQAFGPETVLYRDAPWQVELQWADVDNHDPPFAPTDLHACGGALIRPDWVLTAAHCVWDASRNKLETRLRARAGSQDLSGAMRAYRIDATYLPAGPLAYVVSTRTAPARNDIALLHISPIPTPPALAAQQAIAQQPDEVPRLAPIPVVRPIVIPPKADLTVSGWGATEEQTLEQQDQREVQNGRLRMSPSLRIVALSPVDNAACSGLIRQGIQSVTPDAKVDDIPPTTFCAGSPTSGTCLGDSGGPLVAHAPQMRAVRRHGRRVWLRGPDAPVLVGVVSWGVGCQGLTVFTRVAAYNAWIAATLAGKTAPTAPAAAAPAQSARLGL